MRERPVDGRYLVSLSGVIAAYVNAVSRQRVPYEASAHGETNDGPSGTSGAGAAPDCDPLNRGVPCWKRF